jgi:NTP pyrophosphatase (non-canonical NTP hydrolase)
MDSIQHLTHDLAQFAAVRDWEKYHRPKWLAEALQVEAGELLELYLWGAEPRRADLEDEMADVFIYLVRMADVCGIDLLTAARQKIQRNAERFPEP